jgi:hypothetical protein
MFRLMPANQCLELAVEIVAIMVLMCHYSKIVGALSRTYVPTSATPRVMVVVVLGLMCAVFSLLLTLLGR